MITADELAKVDPGVRDIVARLNAAGFETTDSGDGVSKPDMPCAVPYPHVAAVTTLETMIGDAERMATVLGSGWVVEASYSSRDKGAVLIAYHEVALSQ